MNNFNELTEKELLEINAGGWFDKVIKYGDLVYDFASGLYEGFRDTVRSFPD